MVKIYSTQFLIKNSPSLSSCNLPRFVLHGTEFRVVFSSAVWFGTEFREFSTISISTEQNSELFSLPRKGSERNSASMLHFLIHGTEFRVVFSSTEGFGTEFREFLFRGTAGIPSEITICSVNSVFRGIIFLSEIPNPMYYAHDTGTPKIRIVNCKGNSMVFEN
jgi:hypothetical protein